VMSRGIVTRGIECELMQIAKVPRYVL
jgi:hypothetical protein